MTTQAEIPVVVATCEEMDVVTFPSKPPPWYRMARTGFWASIGLLVLGLISATCSTIDHHERAKQRSGAIGAR